MLSNCMMAMSPAFILSQERWKIRVIRSSEGSSERITKLEFLWLLCLLEHLSPGSGNFIVEQEERIPRFPSEKCPILFASPLSTHYRNVFCLGLLVASKGPNGNIDIGTLQALCISLAANPPNTEAYRMT